VVCYHVLEHLPDPIGTLTEIRRILRPSGLLLIAVPNIGGLIARICKEHWLGVDVPRHLFHFSPETLKIALSRTGFDEQSLSTLSLEQDIFGFSQSMMNMLGFYNVFYDFIRSPEARMRHKITGSPFTGFSFRQPF
jgi:predicted SAM-dependent methyltransferase